MFKHIFVISVCFYFCSGTCVYDATLKGFVGDKDTLRLRERITHNSTTSILNIPSVYTFDMNPKGCSSVLKTYVGSIEGSTAMCAEFGAESIADNFNTVKKMYTKNVEELSTTIDQLNLTFSGNLKVSTDDTNELISEMFSKLTTYYNQHITDVDDVSDLGLPERYTVWNNIMTTLTVTTLTAAALVKEQTYVLAACIFSIQNYGPMSVCSGSATSDQFVVGSKISDTGSVVLYGDTLKLKSISYSKFVPAPYISEDYQHAPCWIDTDLIKLGDDKIYTKPVCDIASDVCVGDLRETSLYVECSEDPTLCFKTCSECRNGVCYKPDGSFVCDGYYAGNSTKNNIRFFNSTVEMTNNMLRAVTGDLTTIKNEYVDSGIWGRIVAILNIKTSAYISLVAGAVNLIVLFVSIRYTHILHVSNRRLKDSVANLKITPNGLYNR